MMEGVAARLLSWQRGLTGWHEARQRVYSHTGERQERGRAGPQARAGSTSQRGGLLASEASWIINRDAQFITVCSASNLGEVSCMTSPVQGASPAKTWASSRP